MTTILNETTIETPNSLRRLYALTDAERFPAAHQLDEGQERPATLFYADFKVAEAFGAKAVRDTMRNCGDLRKRDWKEVVELIAVLNNLGREAHLRGDKPLADYYFRHYQFVDAVAKERIAGDEEKANYLFRITD